jgi:hypothetical protein
VKKLAEAIAIYDTEQQSPVDFYDFKNSQKSSTFTLCYADFTALEIVAKMSVAAEKLPENALTIVENGYIGEEFPFYYNSYSYEDGTYDTSSLNMAEALYTLYHLAEAGKLKDSSLAWLQTHMEDNGIFARYDVQGNVVPGYEYESPAIYALVGLIAQETGEEKLLTQALSRMEEWRVFDTEDTANGAFGTQGIGQMMSYDQCMALLLYGKIEGQGVSHAF